MLVGKTLALKPVLHVQELIHFTRELYCLEHGIHPDGMMPTDASIGQVCCVMVGMLDNPSKIRSAENMLTVS